MRSQFLMACMAIFLIGTLLSCLCSGRWLLNGETDIVNALASFNTMEVQAGGVWNAPKTLSTYWDAIITALSWDYPYLEGDWASLIRLGLCIVTVGAVWGFIQVAMPIIQGLVGMVRYFLPGG